MGSFLLSLLLTLATSLAHGSTRSSTLKHHSVVDYEEIQILPSFPSISAPVSTSVTNGRCHNESKVFLEALENGNAWALKMFDSSAICPTGLFFGSSDILGHFDECLSVRANVSADGSSTTSTITGKYCLTTFKIRTRKSIATNNDSLSNMKYYVEKMASLTIDPIRMSSCIPSSCTAADLRTHLSHVISKLDRLKKLKAHVEDIEVSLDEENCSILEEHRGVTVGQAAMLSCIMLLVILCAVGTTIDSITEPGPVNQNGSARKIFLCFSFKRNIKTLYNSSNKDVGPIPGMKCLFMFGIIVVHRGMMMVYMAPSTREALPSWVTNEENLFLQGIVRNGIVIMEAFFFMTGYLQIHTARKNPERLNSVSSMLKEYLRRYIRLTPVYMFSLALAMTIAWDFGSGPVWKITTGHHKKCCQENWWTNALYLNNYINPESMCLPVSWYLAADLQLYFVAIPIVYLLLNRPRIGKIVLGGFLALSVSIPIIIVYSYEMSPQYMPQRDLVAIGSKYDILFTRQYIPMYMRGILYAMGICSGYYIYDLKNNSKMLSHGKTIFIHAGLIILTFLAPLIESFIFHDGYKFKGLLSAVYTPFPQVFRGLGLFCVIYLFATGKEGFTLRPLSWNIFGPLSRLTYGAYIVHWILQVRDLASIQQVQEASSLRVLQAGIADFFFSIAASFVLAMLVEVPVINLGNIIMSRNENVKDKGTADVIDKSELEIQTIRG